MRVKFKGDNESNSCSSHTISGKRKLSRRRELEALNPTRCLALRAAPRRVRALSDLFTLSRRDNSRTPRILKTANFESRWHAARKGPKLCVLRQGSREGVAAHASDLPELGRGKTFFDVSKVTFHSDESTGLSLLLRIHKSKCFCPLRTGESEGEATTTRLP